jgi:hypothetical protein
MEVAEIARDFCVAHLAKKLHVLMYLAVVALTLLSGLIVYDLDMALGVEDHSVGTAAGLQLPTDDRTLIEDLPRAIKPSGCFGMLYDGTELSGEFFSMLSLDISMMYGLADGGSYITCGLDLGEDEVQSTPIGTLAILREVLESLTKDG